MYYDPRALDLEGPGGVLHAKAVVVDDEAVFVTSANLTEAPSTETSRSVFWFATAHSRLTIGGYFGV